jgi:ATP-binding cassette, subfamily C, bacterial CydC
MTTLRRLLVIARMPRGRTSLAILLGVCAVLFGVGLMTTAGFLISRAAEHPPILSLTIAIVAVRFFGLSRPLARYAERLASHDLALRTIGRIRSRVYSGMEPLAPAELADFRRGDLLTRMVKDVDALQGLYLRGIGPPLVAIISAGACVVAAWLILPAAGVVLAVGLLACGVAVPTIAGTLARSSGGRQSAVRGELTAELVELLRGGSELAIYGQERATIERVRACDLRLAGIARRDALVGGLAESLAVASTGFTLVAVLALAVGAHHTGGLGRVLIATLALLALSSFESVAPLPATARELAATLGAGRRVLGIVDREPRVRDPEHPSPPPVGPTSVALHGVTARYPSSPWPVFEGLDLRLDPGDRVALVGESGSGKTTVTNLLLRFLDPEEGRITVNGIDLRAYRQHDVRRMFAMAGQDAHVFDSTIRANLALARPDATEVQLREALGRARLNDWVAALPEGLDTAVGEEGSHLSGGQRQRLVLARALLSEAPVLVLDEPTAHLDRTTASTMMRDVFADAGDRTILLITHRPEGLDLVDRIVTLGA